jgi:PAS domain-containing protein
MNRQAIQLILSRHLASHLRLPIFIVDIEGELLYFNPSAEPILGCRYEETGLMNQDDWSTVFSFEDEDRLPLEPEEVPLSIALAKRCSINRRLWLNGMDNVDRHIETICFPLIDKADRLVGGIAIFWELRE